MSEVKTEGVEVTSTSAINKKKWFYMVGGAVAGIVLTIVCSFVGNSVVANSVAATVNGENITEQAVSDYIAAARSAQGITDDDTFKEYLKSYDMTPSDVRSSAVQTLRNQVIIRQVASELGVKVDESAINDEIASTKESLGNDEEAWSEYLSQNGMTEQNYRETLEMNQLVAGIKSRLADEIVVEDADVVGQINTSFPDAAEVKHIYALQYSTEDASAVAATERLRNGEITFEDLATEMVGSMENADYGWRDTSAFKTLLGTEDVNLAINEISEPYINDTTHTGTIVMYTDEFSTPGNLATLESLPDSVVEYYRDTVKTSKGDAAYNSYMNNFVNHSTITLYAMPSGLAYDISLD